MSAEHQLADAAAKQAQAFLARSGRGCVESGDDLEVATPEHATPALPTTVHIRYENGSGEVSERDVTLLEAWRTGETVYFKGRCHLRRMIRTFRADRVLELICLATGEVPDDPAAWICSHALFEGQHENDYTPHALRLCRDELALLAFVANADGVLDGDEVEVAVDYVMLSTDREIDRAKAETYIRRLAPSVADVSDHLTALGRRPEHWARLSRAMRRLVDADRVITLQEQMAWADISRGFEDACQAGKQAEKAAERAELEELISGGSAFVKLELPPSTVKGLLAAAMPCSAAGALAASMPKSETRPS